MEGRRKEARKMEGEGGIMVRSKVKIKLNMFGCCEISGMDGMYVIVKTP